jgi:AcrR family transcriptional regulator
MKVDRVRAVARRKGEVRRDEILRAAVRELERRGFAHTRVADIAAELGVSTALVFYHFDTKEALFAAAFADAAERDVRRLEEAVAAEGPSTTKLRAILRLYAPVGAASGWPLWIDAWAAAMREPALRRVSRRLDVRWKDAVAAVITAGVDNGELTCPDPHAAAWRITAMLDGLAVQVTVHKGVVTRTELSTWVAELTERELGLPSGALSE